MIPTVHKKMINANMSSQLATKHGKEQGKDTSSKYLIIITRFPQNGVKRLNYHTEGNILYRTS